MHESLPQPVQRQSRWELVEQSVGDRLLRDAYLLQQALGGLSRSQPLQYGAPAESVFTSAAAKG
jgi:hypothetical protein